MTLSLEHQSGILSKLLSCGVSLLAEVFRLRTTLPEDISDVSKSRFKSILLEFSYFETPIEFDQKIEDNVGLKDLDEEFTELHRGYVLDFSKFMHRLCSFIFEFAEYTQKYATVDVLLDTEWNKIHSQRADVLYHLGIILIFLDEKFLASSREALFVAGQRLGDKFASTHFETSISLLRERKDVFENCFVHLGVDRKFAENVLEYVRTFSLIQTQDVGMSSRKSSLVYIALWFIPNVLRDEGPLMRTLVDAFFGDQWILPLHFELTANVLQKWKNYKPAILALRGVLRQEHVASIVQQKIEILKSNKLPSGLLSLEEFEYYKKTLVVCNSALKWIILHFGDLERFKKISILFDPFKYLLTLIKFEYKFKQSALFTIKNKTAQADKLKERISSSIDQVVHILDRSQESWKTKVSAWLGKINDKLSAIGVVNPKSVNVIESVKLKLEEISEITSDDQRVINQYLEVILKNLDSLKTVILLNFDFLNTLDTQCDADYLWNCISGWVPKLESLLQSEPVMVKYFFFKLKSPIEVKVAGMSTEKSEAIAVFYHKILETYLKRIVQAIPRGVFVELEELQSLLIDDEYCFIEKSKVKNIIQSERRRRLAEKTCKISKLSLGISNMCLSKLGQVEITPGNMLYDGLKQELRLKLKHVFSGVIPTNIFFNVLKQQREELDKLRKTFLFVCQQIGINGVQVWQTELSTITIDALNSCFSRFTSEKQSVPLKSTAFNAFILKMLQFTDPTSTVFSLKSLEWWNQTKSKLEYSTTILLISHQWIPSFFLIGIRRIIQKMLVNEINNFGVLLMRHQNIGSVDQIGSIDQLTKTPEFSKFYSACLPLISKIGQYAVLDDALSISIAESSISEVSLLRKAAKTALDYSQLQETKSGVESMEIPRQLEAILEKTGLVDYSHLVVPLPPFSKSRNSLIIFSILSQCLSTNAITTKKSEFMDPFSIVKGIEKIKTCFELDYQFEYPLSIISGDSAGYLVARRLKIDNINHPFKNVPEPFKK